ncbi:signal peptide peptidase SppA [Roseateles saccharophilus]|uniref:Protease-4 n=1 Tax=Roseateles saccharophilus TaxID=304 RepID=A0A4V6P2W4_ROSSA|nr:signal peptide peptidase SppA [Roseateles saccharophilus]MDG0831150.1 signal peptide peptidase SppA [Roseateles saccharophilus]TCV04270.1 protease-4 [Roseateles saccharophilus]
MKSLFSKLGWLFSKAWWLLDGTRRALMNLFVLLLIVVFVAALLARGPKPLADRTTLVLKLDGNLVEQFSGSPREQLMAQAEGRGVPKQTRLRDVLAALDTAARDDKIAAVLLDVEELQGAGQAGLHEVAAALQRFRKASGKPVLTYADNYSQRGYFLAAQTGEVYLHPMGMVMLEGFGRWRTYYKDALDRLGVTAHVLKVGTYKSFAEPYTATGPSPATQEAEGLVYGELWSGFTGSIEAARKLDAGSIARGIDELPQRLAAVQGDPARLALQARLVDGLKTRDQMRELLIAKGAKDEQSKSFRQVSLADYMAYVKDGGAPSKLQPGLGIVVAEGEIVDGDVGPGRIGGDSTARLIRKAREDDAIKAVVLRVNSPGGSAFASEVIRRELELTRQAGKPVVVSMGDVAASGGYWISMSSDAVIADAGTITGSIGVFGILPTAEGLMDKLSLHTGGVTTTWLAGGYDPRRPLDPRLKAAVQSGIDNIYARFTTLAAQARKSTPEKIDTVAQGRIWTGAQAKERGLVDRIGSFDDAVQAAAKLARLDLKAGEKPRLSYVERDLSRSERLLASLSDTLAPSLLQSLGASLGLEALPAPVAEELSTLKALAKLSAQGHWERAAAVHCLCAAP